ncbi:uncharacterized protein LOC133635515 isoform X2 [Entelurus aequoreus]|uniref:uncharacterized protein LOC133635515 isoform X2 n=1 Tax=Entelurus aequoreus TaxID=161455 RepID=UPI002B1E411A|nr:uncharacterized protein LOC133635515 isoform X2 [Entelurus aequoreus]
MEGQSVPDLRADHREGPVSPGFKSRLGHHELELALGPQSARRITSAKIIFSLSTRSGASRCSRRSHKPPTTKRKRRNTASVKRESILNGWRSSQ